MRQVLVNLIGNAVKFTDEGRVELSVCEVVTPPASKMHATPAAEDKGEVAWLRFDILDTGPGIPTEMQQNLFNEFSQGDQPVAHDRTGTGLGLAISKRIVELMGGRIDFTSAPGRGSHFWFEVPLSLQAHSRRLEHSLIHTPTEREPEGHGNAPAATASLAPPTPKALPAIATSGRNGSAPRVLIAEDNAVNQLLAVRALEDAGFAVDAVSNGKDAVLAAEKTVYDVIVMDVQMPEMNGLDAAKGGTTAHGRQRAGSDHRHDRQCQPRSIGNLPCGGHGRSFAKTVPASSAGRNSAALAGWWRGRNTQSSRLTGHQRKQHWHAIN